MADAPIGIFDSGFGGLTVARAVLDQLPHESVALPRRHRPPALRPAGRSREVREYALECLDHLVDQGVKVLVIACNSASAAMLRDARERYDVPVVEVIRPAVRRAVAATRNGRVGVICTAGHRTSRGAYDDAFAAAPQIDGDQPAVPALRRVRRGGRHRRRRSCSASPTSTSTRSPSAGVDTLVLGCTHYPLLTGVISYVMGDDVTLVSQRRGDRQGRLPRARRRRPAARPDDLPAPSHRFLTTGDPSEFARLGRRFLGPEVALRSRRRGRRRGCRP